jgi:hypothetical protein
VSRDDFRILVDVDMIPGRRSGVALEVTDAAAARPLILSALGPFTATTLDLSVDEGRLLFDALAQSLALVTTAAGARHAAGGDTPADPGTRPLSDPSARV